MRKSKLKLNKRIYVTDEAYETLRRLKKEQHKSMAQITIDLIEKESGETKKILDKIFLRA